MKPDLAFTPDFVAALREGKDEVWNRFFDCFNDLIAAVIGWRKWSFDAHTREDLAQTIRAELVRSIHHLKDSAHLPGYVKRIAIRRCIDQLRRQMKDRSRTVSISSGESEERHEFDLPAGESYEPVRAILLAEKAQCLRRLLDQLEEPCRIAIHDFYVENLSYKEIATRREMSINTVGTRLARCLERLRKLVESEPDLREILR